MSHEIQKRQDTAAHSESSAPESEGKTMSPPAFQLQASDAPAQLKPNGDDPSSGAGSVVTNISTWLHNLLHPQNPIKNAEVAAPVAPQAEAPAAEAPVAEGAVAEGAVAEQQQVLEQATAEPEAEAEQTREEQVSELLMAYYEGFSAITVNIPNPDPAAEVPTVEVQVRPPYMINTTTRRTNAEANRTANRAVNRIINTFPWGFRHGKASASDIQSFLQQAINANLTTDNSSAGLRTFLDHFGIGVDCSGFVSQGYNGLIGDLDVDANEFVVNDTGSGSFRATSDRFTAVTSPSDLKPGDAMFLENGTIDHIRMVQNVTITETTVDLVIIESRGGQGPDLRYWRYTSLTEFTGLQRSSDGGTTYEAVTETPEWARMDALYPAAEEGADAEAAPTTGN